jgi:glutamyl-tRNA synthetase
MHLGNLFSALLAWLDVRHDGGTMVFRVEDLDPDRCTLERARQVADDLAWLGLDWDEGGVEPDYCQSNRSALYEAAFQKLESMGLTYPCYCTRAERLAASAPHRADGTVVYDGRCARLTPAERAAYEASGRRPAMRVRVPDENIVIQDGNLGRYEENLRRDCGDFILRRSDGVWAYQLAVVVDDALMGVTRVVRGGDLLSSAPRQAWLCRTLGYEPPTYCHVPLLLAPDGRRLSKRDGDLDMGALREKFTPAELTGLLAHWAGLLNQPEPVRPEELIAHFSWDKVTKQDVTVLLP